MKKTLLILFSVLLFSSGADVFVAPAQTPLAVSPSKHSDIVPGVLYIQLKAKHGIDFGHLSPTHTGNTELDRFFAGIGVTDIYPFDTDAKNYAVARRHGIDRMYVIEFSEEGISPLSVQKDMLALDVIESASPQYVFQSCSYTPNDPQIPVQYALDNSHMHLFDAWGVSKGSANIIIADVDEGVNYNHEDLAGNIHKLGQYFGYDIVGDSLTGKKFNPDNDPMPGPNQNHGTMTSGCFGAVCDNNKGGAGTGFNCKIMAIKIADDAGNLYGGFQGIQYAVEHGAKIINCSWRAIYDPQSVLFVQPFIDEAIDTGALVIASSGNDGLNIDGADSLIVPAILNGVLSVGWTNIDDSPNPQSNSGHRVSVWAPGSNIFSTSLPNVDSYNFESGTSFSAPLTSGVAGLLWAKNPGWTPKFIARQIIQSADNVVNPSDRKHYWGRVNAYSALTDQTVPGLEITDFKVDGVEQGGLDYQNKTYSIDVTFKNYMAAGTSIQARLIPVPGYSDVTLPLYTIQQDLANLGSMSSGQSTVGSFKFTRDTNDYGAGSQLPLSFVIYYGSATVEGDKYFDTLILNVNITGDNNYTPAGVAEKHSNILQLGETYPNPVSEDAAISFELADRGYVSLSICDVLGRPVSTLSDGIYDAGSHTVHFDTRTMADGVYIYRLETSDGTLMTKRMIVVH